MTEYYDVVLGVIPLALVGITGVLAAFGLSLTSGVTVGSAASICVIYHAMFVNGPVEDDTGTVDRSTESADAGGVQAPTAD